MRQVWQGKYSKVKPGQDRGGRVRREGKVRRVLGMFAGPGERIWRVERW